MTSFKLAAGFALALVLAACGGLPQNHQPGDNSIYKSGRSDCPPCVRGD